ncbi:MAG: NAD(P)-dependent oxidoreductase [Syntrophobacteraceae bacterium]
MKRLLITGASGFLGWNLCRFAREEWETFGTAHAHAIPVPGVHIRLLDVTVADDLVREFRLIQPDAVIHTAAVSNPNFCETHPADSERINVAASIQLAALCRTARIPCLFTSTDLVFDGRHPPYSETAPTAPVNVYGMQKVMAEQGMLRVYPHVTVCRMPLMFGDPGPAASSFIQPMIRALKGGKELRLFTDEFRTPVSGSDAAFGLLLVLRKSVTGIIHLGGVERVSRYAFGEMLVEAFGFGGARLVPCLQRDVPMAASRPGDVSLDSSKAYALGFRPAPLIKSLGELAGQL